MSSYTWDERFAAKGKVGFKRIYERSKANLFHSTAFYNILLRKIIKRYLPGKSNILEIGCGKDSFILDNFSEYKYSKLIEYDYSIEGLRQMREIFQKNNRDAVFIKGDASCVSLQSNKIDFLLSISMIEYLTEDQLRSFFTELSRIITNDGTAVILYPSSFSFLRRKCMEYARIHDLTPNTKDTNTIGDLQEFIKNTDLIIIEQNGIGLVSQLFYLGFYFSTTMMKRAIRPVVTVLVLFLGACFFWTNLITSKRGDYVIAVIKKASNK